MSAIVIFASVSFGFALINASLTAAFSASVNLSTFPTPTFPGNVGFCLNASSLGIANTWPSFVTIVTFPALSILTAASFLPSFSIVALPSLSIVIFTLGSF